MLDGVERVPWQLLVHNSDQIDDGQQPLIRFPLVGGEDALDGRPHTAQIGHVRGEIIRIVFLVRL